MVLPRSLTVAAALGLATLAGCGSDAAPQAGPADTTSVATAPTPDAANPAATSGSAAAQRPGKPDFSAPAAASGSGLPLVAATIGLKLAAAAGATPKWSLTAKQGSDGNLCVTVKSPGIADEDPLCNSGTLLALSFFSDQGSGHGLADVDVIARSSRTKPTDLLVSGVVSADVERVTVTFAGIIQPAVLTTSGTRLTVSRSQAKKLTGASAEKIASMPSSVTLRAFAISLPVQNGNPPKTATAATAEPVKGTLNFQLS